MTYISGLRDEGRRLRQRVDVGDAVAQAADHVGVGFLAETDVGLV
jgi:hypothetical protein